MTEWGCKGSITVWIYPIEIKYLQHTHKRNGLSTSRRMLPKFYDDTYWVGIF